MSKLLRATFAVVFLSLSLTASARAGLVSTLDEITFWTGSGANEAALVVDWDNAQISGDDDRSPLAWGFRWESGTTATGQDMFDAIVAAEPRLVLDTEYFPLFDTSALFGIGYDRDADGFSTGDPDDSYRYLDFDDAGGETWTYFTAESSPFDGSADWNEAGLGFGSRELSTGSWDGWRVNFNSFVFPAAPPASGPRQPFAAAPAAVPEPGTWLLILAAAGGGLAARRRGLGRETSDV